MERKPVNAPDLSAATDPDLRASFPALQRAAEMARKAAIQTETDLVVIQEGRLVHLTADELREQNPRKTKA